MASLDKVVHLDTDTRFRNPFNNDANRFKDWLEKQERVIALLRYLRQHDYKFVVSKDNEYYKEVVTAILATPKPKDPVFVFGSNLKGIHGAGAALTARAHHGAQIGVGVGPTGNAYAIPTKVSPGEILPLNDIQGHVQTFVRYAQAHPDEVFAVTRIGTGLGGYKNSQIKKLFDDTFQSVGKSDNIILPYAWTDFKHHRVIVAGCRQWGDERYESLVQRRLTKLPDIGHLILGGARGIDAVAERVAVKTGRVFYRYPAWWELFNKSAGYNRNGTMAYDASACIALWDGVSKGTGGMITTANNCELDLILSINP